MAYNQNLVQTEEVVFTGSSLTLGFGAGQTVPPRYIVCEPTGAMTITLPLSTPTLPNSPSTPYIPGSGPGYPITIYNNSSQTITILAASGDTLQNIPALAVLNSSISVFSSPTENIWYGYERGASNTAASFNVSATGLGASSTSSTLYIADQPLIVTDISAVWGTASAAGGTVNAEKATGTVAVGSGTALLTAGIATNGTANTVVAGTLVATTATLTFASGNRLNIILAGTLTSWANAVVTVGLRKLA